eukprot:Protomagalhaensia_wolfi_Nauph_80__1049@NODE_160_length_3372_cov_649_059106_g121_i0_p2_GENE_NODE_160_length_3372_cov_649_059106_g121_i0NODE_160_length_3372_cov_649_059106_g121_i0_p2_ORF_typecomplete_len227_score19_98Gpr1_Fun34_YaaH/PF01184_19/6_9e53Gaa1/PF04114_14/0_63DUF1430/PF07242_11/2_1DUF1430/PF07242_11/3e02AC_N/PF16214_5/10_NODE_160_length_3372_cov_649_059106_g121_i014942174
MVNLFVGLCKQRESIESVDMGDERTANPAPLGLTGFAMSTIMLNLHNCGLFPLNSAIVGLGLVLGGVIQIVAGVFEFVTGNTFGTTAFLCYGGFWLSLVLTWILPVHHYAASTDNVAFGWYLLLWCLFTLCLTVATLKMNFATKLIFCTLSVLFLLLAITRFLNEPKALQVISGVVGVLCGLSALYLALAEVINAAHNREILPVGTNHLRRKRLESFSSGAPYLTD